MLWPTLDPAPLAEVQAFLPARCCIRCLRGKTGAAGRTASKLDAKSRRRSDRDILIGALTLFDDLASSQRAHALH